jgi:hypothetical protein
MMRWIFAFHVLLIAVAASIILARGAFPERLLSPEFETICFGGEQRGSAQGLGTGEAHFRKTAQQGSCGGEGAALEPSEVEGFASRGPQVP